MVSATLSTTQYSSDGHQAASTAPTPSAPPPRPDPKLTLVIVSRHCNEVKDAARSRCLQDVVQHRLPV